MGNPPPLASPTANTPQSSAKETSGSKSVSDSLLSLGALVALSADRYSSLPYADTSSPIGAREPSLPDGEATCGRWTCRLGDLGAYQDLAFLMQHITQNSNEALRPSGYSR